jgi:hypothetical protein
MPHSSDFGYADNIEGLILATKFKLGGESTQASFSDSWGHLLEVIRTCELPGIASDYYSASPQGIIDCLKDKAGAGASLGRHYPGSYEGMVRILIDILAPSYASAPYTANCIGLIAILMDSSLYEAPSNITSVTGGTQGNRSITFSWAAPSTPPVSYTVELSQDGINWILPQQITPPSTSHTYTGLTGPFYFGRVRANYAGGSSKFITSAPVVFTSLLPIIPIPALF